MQDPRPATRYVCAISVPFGGGCRTRSGTARKPTPSCASSSGCAHDGAATCTSCVESTAGGTWWSVGSDHLSATGISRPVRVGNGRGGLAPARRVRGGARDRRAPRLQHLGSPGRSSPLLFSKVVTWVALDRGIRMSEEPEGGTRVPPHVATRQSPRTLLAGVNQTRAGGMHGMPPLLPTAAVRPSSSRACGPPSWRTAWAPSWPAAALLSWPSSSASSRPFSSPSSPPSSRPFSSPSSPSSRLSWLGAGPSSSPASGPASSPGSWTRAPGRAPRGQRGWTPGPGWAWVPGVARSAGDPSNLSQTSPSPYNEARPSSLPPIAVRRHPPPVARRARACAGDGYILRISRASASRCKRFGVEL